MDHEQSGQKTEGKWGRKRDYWRGTYPSVWVLGVWNCQYFLCKSGLLCWRINICVWSWQIDQCEQLLTSEKSQYHDIYQFLRPDNFVSEIEEIH